MGRKAHRFMRNAFLTAIKCAAPFGAALATPTFAQDQAVANSSSAAPASSERRVLTPDFFAQYGPVNALDMVQRIPGFSIEEGEGRRGFGENASNVLIDGDRPSTKTDDIRTILGRISVAQVERIEVIEQAGGDGEARGKGQVVNIIRKASRTITGTYDVVGQVGTRYAATGFANTSATLNRGDTKYELNLGSYWEKVQGRGPEDFRDGARNLIERRTYLGRGRYREASVGGSIKTKLGGAKLNVNGKIALQDGIDRRNGVYTNPAGLQIGTERLFTDEPDHDVSWELGGDVEFGLAPKLTTKLIGLFRTERDRQNAFIETLRTGAATSRFESSNRNRPSEAVFRLQNDWSGLSHHGLQFGVEIAKNQLDAEFLGIGRLGGIETGRSASDVKVRETRIEPFVSDVWTVSPEWKIESGAIFEFSKLRLKGTSQASRSFQFVKPRFGAVWTASKATTFEFRAEHQVAQLDFGEFATSVDLGLGNQIDAGNQDLVPEKVTGFSALLRHKFLERGSIQLKSELELVRDTQDLVPVSFRDANGNVSFFDGAGNIGKSRRWNVELEITLPFDWLTAPIGIKGMELKYVGHYHGSRVRDPVTGRPRMMSFRPEWHQEWEFRHDVGTSGIAWGFRAGAAAPQKAYFVNQYRWQANRFNFNAFIAYKKFKLGTIELKLIDALGEKFDRVRFLYAGSRAGGSVTDIIERTRTLDPRIQLSLTGKF
jgi:outer membrane receptor protein involved in Fe transport